MKCRLINNDIDLLFFFVFIGREINENIENYLIFYCINLIFVCKMYYDIYVFMQIQVKQGFFFCFLLNDYIFVIV